MFKIISKRKFELYKELEKQIDKILSDFPDALLVDNDEEPISTAQRVDLLKIFYKRFQLGIYTKSFKSYFPKSIIKEDA